MVGSVKSDSDPAYNYASRMLFKKNRRPDLCFSGLDLCLICVFPDWIYALCVFRALGLYSQDNKSRGFEI